MKTINVAFSATETAKCTKCHQLVALRFTFFFFRWQQQALSSIQIMTNGKKSGCCCCCYSETFCCRCCFNRWHSAVGGDSEKCQTRLLRPFFVPVEWRPNWRCHWLGSLSMQSKQPSHFCFLWMLFFWQLFVFCCWRFLLACHQCHNFRFIAH